MKKIICVLIFNGVLFCCKAQLNIYSALTIPDSLKKDADIVIRDEGKKLTIKDKNTAKYEVHQVFTVMNAQAKDFLSFVAFSDKFHTLDDAEIKVFDLLGKKINTWSKKEMTSLNYGEGLVPEGKVTYFDVSAPAYPVTVEINYTIKYRGILDLPDYIMQHSWQSVQHSVYEVEVPVDLGFRYKLLNTEKKPDVSATGTKSIYRWELNNMPAFKLEKHSGSSEGYLPTVLIAPNKFQLDEYDGDMTSWKNYGLWINDLYAKVSGLPEEKKAFYREMVKGAKSDEEKASILYNYLQHNMRYVSIQLGIGGWRPFPAEFVNDKKYGDCKALSNYLKTTLEAVGIKSNLVIIYRDYEPRVVDENFPMNDFNHVILCIPGGKDSTWLECTSTTLPFASLDETTLNRKAVMITDAGGVLINTPASNYKINTEYINTIIDIDEAGEAKVKSQYTLFGEERDKLLMRFYDLKDDEKRKYIITHKQWKQPDEFNISSSKNKDNPYQVNSSMTYEKIYSFKAGNKLFFEPRLYLIFDEEIVESEKRMRDYYFTYPYQCYDTTVYKFSTGYTMESLPKNKSLKFSFGEYICSYNWDATAHTVTSTALLQIKERVVKAADYSKLVDFKKLVMADVNEKIVMKRE